MNVVTLMPRNTKISTKAYQMTSFQYILRISTALISYFLVASFLRLYYPLCFVIFCFLKNPYYLSPVNLASPGEQIVAMKVRTGEALQLSQVSIPLSSQGLYNNVLKYVEKLVHFRLIMREFFCLLVPSYYE